MAMTDSWLYDWVIWTSLGIGLVVSGLVYGVGRWMRPIRMRRKVEALCEDDIPWEGLLEVMKTRYGAGKSGADEELPGDEMLEELLAEVPEGTPAPADAHWSAVPERRRGMRRWFNPIEVVLISPVHENPLPGLVVNRSSGGLAILMDVAFDTDTVLSVRPKYAPAGVKYVYIRVRHARKASKLWVIGCQYEG